MKSKLKTMLKPSRYQHVLGVADEAVKLAKLYGQDEDKAYIAALLHDCAKAYSIEKQIEYCNHFGIVLDEIEKHCLPIIHAPLGVYVAKSIFGITDDEILTAIKYHTTGRKGMSVLEKIIYISDMTEPLRDFNGVLELRKMSEQNIDDAMLLGLKQSMKYNLKKGVPIHPDTLSAWNDIIINKEEEI